LNNAYKVAQDLQARDLLMVNTIPF